MGMLPYRKNKQTLLIEDCADLIRDFKYQFQSQTKQDEAKGHTRVLGIYLYGYLLQNLPTLAVPRLLLLLLR